MILSVGQIYKGFIFILIFITILRTKLNNSLKLYLFITLMYFSSITLMHNIYSPSNLLNDAVFTFKIIFNITVFIYFYLFFKKNKTLNSVRLIDKTINISYIFLILNFIFGALGYGFSTYYYGDLGIKGFYYAGNELALLLVVLNSYKIFNGYKKGISSYLFYSFLALGLALATAMKTAIGGTLLLILIIPMISRIKTYKHFYKLAFYVPILVGSIGLLITGVFKYLGGQFAVARWIYFIKEYGLMSGLLSSRDQTLLNVFNEFYYNFSISWSLFGKGLTNFLNGATIEIDFFDVFFIFGFIGLLLVYGAWIYIIKRIFTESFKSIRQNLNYKYLFIINSLIFVASFTTGHVVYSTSTVLFLGMITAFYFQISGRVINVRKIIRYK